MVIYTSKKSLPASTKRIRLFEDEKYETSFKSEGTPVKRARLFEPARTSDIYSNALSEIQEAPMASKAPSGQPAVPSPKKHTVRRHGGTKDLDMKHHGVKYLENNEEHKKS